MNFALRDAVRASGFPCAYALDAVCLHGSQLTLAQVLAETSEDGKGKVAGVLPLPDDERAKLPQGVEVERISVGTAYGDDQKCMYFAIFTLIF